MIKKVAIIGSILLSIGLILGIIASATSKESFFDVISYQNNEKIEEKTINNEKISDIDIDFGISEVNIYSTTKDKISYEYYGNRDSNFKMSNDDKKLMFVNSKHDSIITGFKFNRLDLYIPQKNKYSFDINVAVGNININDLKADDFNVENDVGSIRIEYVNVSKDMNVSSDVGEIKIENVKGPKRIEVKNEIGAIKMDNVYSKDIRLTSDIGEIKFSNDDLTYKVTRLDVDSEIGSEKIDVGR